MRALSSTGRSIKLPRNAPRRRHAVFDFTLREKVNGSTRWWRVVAFDEASIAAVLSMKVGEPIAVSGEFSAELWTPEGGGEPRLSWKITADAVLSAKAKPKQRTGREVADTSWAAP